MTNLQEVPTDELLSFQDYPSVHNSPAKSAQGAQINVTMSEENYLNDQPGEGLPAPATDSTDSQTLKSFWTLEYYQTFFDVDTKDVTERILGSLTPLGDNNLKLNLRNKPDLYGPFWISITLIFTIAISGNIANYLQHANTETYHWKYDFHLVSIAATTICLYVTLIPFTLWGLLKWSSDVSDLDGLESGKTPGALELICLYGYSLFIYIPVSILWTIQYSVLQWILVGIAVFVSGSALLFSLRPALKLSRYYLLLTIGIICCHLLLAAGFKWYFFHMPASQVVPVVKNTIVHLSLNDTT